MIGIQYLPPIMLTWFIGVLCGFGAAVYASFGSKPSRARAISIASLVYSAVIFLIWAALLKNDIAAVAYFLLAVPFCFSGLAWLLSVRPQFKFEVSAHAQKIKRTALVTTLSSLAILAMFLISRLFVGVDQELLNLIQPGMAKDQVLRILGTPQGGGDEDRLWEYHIKEFGWDSFMSPFCISFDEQGKVDHTWVH